MKKLNPVVLFQIFILFLNTNFAFLELLKTDDTSQNCAIFNRIAYLGAATVSRTLQTIAEIFSNIFCFYGKR